MRVPFFNPHDNTPVSVVYTQLGDNVLKPWRRADKRSRENAGDQGEG